MEIATMLSQTDLSKVKSLVESANKSLQDGKGLKNVLDKNDFLKLLLTQLTHQDPTQPMQDREFIAQMASFSTLEQMTNMNDDLGQIFSMMRRSNAVGLLGKTVDVLPASGGAQAVTGLVQEVSGDEYPQVKVNGTFYDFADVLKIRS